MTFPAPRSSSPNTSRPRPRRSEEKRPELAALDPVFAKAMAKKPDDRFASCQEFVQELWRALAVEPVTLDHTRSASANLEATQAESINVQDTQIAPTGPPPVQLPPPAPWPAPAPRRRAWQPKVLIPAAVAIAVLAGGVFVGVKLSQGNDNKTPANPAPAAPENTGPLTGRYRADFSPPDTFGKPDQDGTPATGTWDMRSACRSTGCLATTTSTGGPTLQPSFVFDDVGGQWIAVSVGTVTAPPPNVSGFVGCKFPGEYWSTVTLRPQPNGSLSGDYTAMGGNCHSHRTVTFTRTGDVDVNTLPDPVTEPPRVTSPGEALHGRYHYATTTSDNRRTPEADFNIRTDCLRTAERCETLLQKVGTTGGGDQLIFVDGQWTWSMDEETKCESGGSSRATGSITFPVPQPLQNPIATLTGRGHMDVAPGTNCSGSYDLDAKFERTGG